MADYDDKVKILKSEIKDIKIQGATNVALAVLDGIKLVAEKFEKGSVDLFIEEVERVGLLLSEARENEPLAKNGLRYILNKIKAYRDLNEARKKVSSFVQEYIDLIENSKQKIFDNGVKELTGSKVILTHCHSSTSTKILVELSKRDPSLTVVSTETRPLFQGRLTAKELADADVNVTQIVDSAAPAFIEDDRYLPVSSVIVGCDELLKNGGFINKVGTYSMALSAKLGEDKFYVATTLLKLNLEKSTKFPEIEMRSAREVWAEAPDGLKIINPSFDFVPPKYVTAFITEAGVIKPGEVKDKALELYEWLDD